MSIEELKKVSGELTKAKSDAKEFAKTRGKEVLGAAFLTVFERFPELGKFTWTQYTPYFNDGDPCRFRVHDPSALPSSDIDGDTYDYELGTESPEELSAECRAALNEIWGSLHDDLLHDMFGDHVEVTITKGEVSVEEYSHD